MMVRPPQSHQKLIFEPKNLGTDGLMCSLKIKKCTQAFSRLEGIRQEPKIQRENELGSSFLSNGLLDSLGPSFGLVLNAQAVNSNLGCCYVSLSAV